MTHTQFLPTITLPDKTYRSWEWRKCSPKMKCCDIRAYSLKQYHKECMTNSVEKIHVDVGAWRVNHTTFPFTPSREKISVSNDLVNWRDNPFLVLDVFDPQWLLLFHSTYILWLQNKILSEHTTFSHNKGRRFGETRLVTFSKFCTWEFEIVWNSWTSPYEHFYNDDTSLWCTVLFAAKDTK